MPIRVDAHVHVFPNPFNHVAPFMSLDQMSQWKRQARHWVRPLAGTAHHLQTLMRHLPQFARKSVDQIGALVPASGLLVESSVEDLLESMQESEIDYALVIAHPPFISNEFVLELAQEHPQCLPVVYIPREAHHPSELLRAYVKQGARALKIHPAADGEGIDSLRYRQLLQTAQELGLLVILHTGCIHSPLLYRNSHLSHVENFRPWFENYPEMKFILAHMNFHQPEIALNLCEEFRQLIVDTSWQPAEVIGEAVRRIGAERVLFGTDWPLIGSNMRVGRQRIDDAIRIGMLNESQAQLILGENAAQLLGLKSDAI